MYYPEEYQQIQINHLQNYNIINREVNIARLNNNQKKVIDESIKTPDFLMIKAYPGCGKKYTIVVLLKILLLLRKKVLITCFTHKTLNIILNKLEERLSEEEKNQVLRLVKNRKIRENNNDSFDVLPNKDQIFNNLEEYKNYIERYIYASTIQTLETSKFKKTNYDYIIIDECSMIFEPTIIRALTYGQKFILFGDYKQLGPPFKILSGKSFFKQMCRDYSLKTIELSLQYRMNEDIIKLANALIYNHKISSRFDFIEEENFFDSSLVNSNWLRNSLNKINTNSVILLNTQDFNIGQAFIEENIAIEIYKAINTNSLQENVRVITNFNRQFNYLFNNLINDNIVKIDKSYGTNSEIVILILTCSNQEDLNSHQNVEIVFEDKKINLALTRANKKLIIIGNIMYLNQYYYTRKMIEILEENDWVISINQQNFFNENENIFD